ncbi:MAG: ArsC/Spx/MgsR family protein [Bacteroidota bacterium]|nr:ArsC/Spx/MgsR family protein [Bacteroidota bacterium]
MSENVYIYVLLNNPILIERPILVTEKSAVIGRPPEKILEII